jgi:hypothetical protein
MVVVDDRDAGPIGVISTLDVAARGGPERDGSPDATSKRSTTRTE